MMRCWTMSVGVGLVAAASVAGPLTPPAGPVAPTHKTLTEIEPRIAINATNTPGDAGAVHVISQPGSYYLTGNIAATNKTGIQATVAGVTIDLNGFAITGSGSNHFGIIVGARAKVRNGSLTGWGLSAVRAGDDAIIEDLAIVGQTGSVESTIFVGARSIVRSVSISGGRAAIQVGSHSLVADCAATNVFAGVIGSTRDVTVERCRFSASATSDSGIFLDDRAVVRDCQINGFIYGVFVGSSATVERCVFSGATYGVFAGAGARCTDVTAAGATSHGIYLAGDAGFISGCHFRSCVRAIEVQNDTVIERCVAIDGTATAFTGVSRNTVTGCLAARNTGASSSGFVFLDSNTFTECRSDENGADGFTARFGNIWERCSARANATDGIEGAAGSLVRDCRLDTNGFGATTGANIRITGDASRIEGNTLISGDFGIQITSAGNIVVRNSSRNCPNDYGGIVAGNFVGTIVTSEALMNGAANDLVNIEH